MTAFSLDPRLAADCLPVGRFGLSRLLLRNDATYPWLILVPERPGVSEIFDLDAADLAALAAETALVARLLKTLVGADKINVAALGNVVAQPLGANLAKEPDDLCAGLPRASSHQDR